MKHRTMTALLAAGTILTGMGALTASRLQAQTETVAPAAETIALETRESEVFLAQRGERRRGFGPGGQRGDRTERLVQALDLTEAQASQLQAVREEARPTMEALHENLRAERQALHELMAGDATEADLRTQHQRVQDLHQQVGDQRFEVMLATREILTVEQRAELADLMEQRRQQHRARREGRGQE